MGKRPAFQFYPKDWTGNSNLRRCSLELKGAWIEVLNVLHDQEEYGVVRWPLEDLAMASGVPLKVIKQLVEKNVLKGGHDGCEPYKYIPCSGRVEGQQVTLVECNSGPCWYSSRFVRDEHIRKNRGKNTQFSEKNKSPRWSPKDSPKDSPKYSPKPPFGEWQGDGPSTASASTVNKKNISPNGDIKKKRTRFSPPSTQEVFEYMSTLDTTKPHENLKNEAERFCNYYGAIGWKVGGKAQMKKWQMSVNNWLKRGFSTHSNSVKNKPSLEEIYNEL